MTRFFEHILEPELSSHQKQKIVDNCEDLVSTNFLCCAAYLVCKRHREVWSD